MPAGAQWEWHDLMEASITEGHSDGWLVWLQVGVMRYYIDDIPGCDAAWRLSLEQRRTPWALRNLATLARQAGKREESTRLYSEVVLMRPDHLALAIDCGSGMLANDHAKQWLCSLDHLSTEVSGNGRVRLLEARAAIACGDLERTQRIIESRPIVVDMREGERSLSDLWFELHERLVERDTGTPLDDVERARVREEHQVPVEMDFRMQATD